MAQTLTVKIDKDGRPTLSVSGVLGSKCLEITRDLEAALGGQVLERASTGEMTQVETHTDQKVTAG